MSYWRRLHGLIGILGIFGTVIISHNQIEIFRCASRSQLAEFHHLPRSEELDEHITQMLDRIEKLRLVHEQSRKWHERWEIGEPTTEAEAARVQLGPRCLVNNENGGWSDDDMARGELDMVGWCTWFYTVQLECIITVDIQLEKKTHVIFSYSISSFNKATFPAACLTWNTVSFFFHFLLILRWSGVQLDTRLWVSGSNTQHHLWAFES